MSPETSLRLGLGLAVVLAVGADRVAGQAGWGGADRPPPDRADSLRVLDDAQAAQASFERRRARFLPATLDDHAGSCDEIVGRFCITYQEGEWYPEEERAEVVGFRLGLLGVLDRAASELPGDGWILGQRVWYRAEAGEWSEALAQARGCGPVDVWWCAALEGFALHGSGDFEGALDAFERALGLMPTEQARAWRVPRRAVDSRARGLLDQAGPDALESLLDRVWLLADPLYLVPGNDRRTAHYARWTVTELRKDAVNPFRLPWGADLEG